MATRTLHRGQTVSQSGTLAISNTTTVVLQGGAGAVHAGATAIVTGVLTNSGTIEALAGAQAEGAYGNSLIVVAGTLVNANLIDLGAGTGGGNGSDAGVGAELYVPGVLMNSGTITLHQGVQNQYGPFSSAALVIDGTVVDSGLIVSPVTYGYDFNRGLIQLSGTAQLTVTSTGAITGGNVFNYGLLVDRGSIDAGLSNHGVLALQGGVLNSGPSNFGTITGYGTINGYAITNYGTIEATSGQLTINARISESNTSLNGSIVVDAGATLTVTGTQIVRQVVSLSAGGVIQTEGAAAGVKIVSPQGGRLDVLGGGTATLNAADKRLSVFLQQATQLTLSRMGFVTATGSAGDDRITALSAGQTLTGGLGHDVLTGAAATGDVFADSAAGLDGDTIGGFGGTDTIDVLDLAPGAGLVLGYTQGADEGTLTLTEGAQSTRITLLGSFSQVRFTTGSDGHGGVSIGYH